jgi:hypothetical protein
MSSNGATQARRVRTSQPKWFSELATAYKQRVSTLLIDDASLGIDPLNETLFMMAVRAKLGVSDITAACIALGMAAVGIAIIIAAFIDPEPTSKLSLLIAGGLVLILTGGGAAIQILVKTKPPSVRVGLKGFEINWV